MSEEPICKTIDIEISKNNNKLDSKSNKFSSTIDYNYPSLNRKDLSDLSNINDKRKYFKKLNTKRDWSLNLYNLDIEGSSPRKFGYFFNKEDFINKNSDIEGASPKNFNQNTNKKNFNLTNDDIEFSKPQCVKNASTRHSNPLEPKYNIVDPPILPITPPKFIRDNIGVEDIKGARPKKMGNNQNLFKEPIKKEIIKDSWPRKPYLRKSKYEFLDYRDVTKQRAHFRNTNPLRPLYDWSYVDNTKSFGPIDGNYPLVYSKFVYKNPFILNNKDIEGSNTGSKNRILKFRSKNYSYMTKDIIGAQSGTVIRGIKSNRHINPLFPKYKYLGHSEISFLDNNPYNAGYKSTVNLNKANNQKIMFNQNVNDLKNKSTIITTLNSPSNNNEVLQNKDEKILNVNKNDENKILEKNIKIIEDKKDDIQNKDERSTLIQNEVKSNYEDSSPFNHKESFDKNNYKKQDSYYGITHYPILVPSNININKRKNKLYEKMKIPLKPLPEKMKKRSSSTISEDNNYCSKLDNFIKSRNLRQIENGQKTDDQI